MQGALDLRAGKQAIDAARSQSGIGDLIDGRPLPDLRRAQVRLASGHRRLGGVVLAPVRVLPVVGRQVRALSALSGSAATVSDVTADSLSRARDVAEAQRSTSGPKGPVARELADVAARALDRLDGLDLGPSRGLIGRVAWAHDELSENLTAMRTGLRRGAAGGRALATLLDGPRRYLVLAANNSEMRAGSGMFLQVGELETGGGGLRLSDMQSVNDVALPPGAAPIDGDLRDRWGWLAPNELWQNLMLSPRFDVQAPLAARMWAASGKRPVDGVLALDPVALQGLMRATGPVEVEGRSVSADSVVRELLHDQYVRFTAEESRQRRDNLGRLARSVFSALDAGQWSVADLARGLVPVVDGRHVLAWSASATEQADWSAAGLDGSLGPDSVLVALSSRTGNKLDQFVSVSGAIDVGHVEGDSVVTLRLAVANTVPEGEPTYITGAHEGSGVGEGVYTGILSVSLPGASRDAGIEGVQQLAVAGPDGPTEVVGFPLSLARGEARTVVVRFGLPGRQGALRVEPSARVPPIAWTSGEEAWSDSAPRFVRWS